MLIMFATDFIYILITYVLTIKIICNNSIIHYIIKSLFTLHMYACPHTHIKVMLFLFSPCIPGALRAPQQLPSIALNPRAKLAPSGLLVPQPCSLFKARAGRVGDPTEHCQGVLAPSVRGVLCDLGV